MTVYLRRRPLSSLLVAHANIPLRLPLRNAIRQSTIHWRSIAASAPLLPAKATEGGGGLAASEATVLYRRRRCSVARTVSHNKYDYRCRIAVQMSHRTPRYHRRRVRTAAMDPRWYRSRCCYRCTAAGTAGYHSRCRRCDRCMTGATLVSRSRCHRGRYRSSAVGRKGLGRRNICDRAEGGNDGSDAHAHYRCRIFR